MTSQAENEHKQHNAGFFRRLFAIFYDWFLLLALLFSTTALFYGINQGTAIDSSSTLYLPFVITLALIIFFFFTWFWTHGGQTLGLRTWQCRIVNIDGTGLSWKQASIRFLVALISIAAAGMGFIWSFFNKERKTWHDLASKTQLIDLRK